MATPNDHIDMNTSTTATHLATVPIEANMCITSIPASET
jgi:hypothetical protein